MSNPAPKPVSPRPACPPLMAACTPLIYRVNPFRVSGLPVDATTRDIKRQMEDLKHAEELGDTGSETRPAFALPRPPTLDELREATQRLQDPEQRIIHELFWFWPETWGKGKSDQALGAIARGDERQAVATWSERLAGGDPKASLVAMHNFAVMHHLLALDAELAALEKGTPGAPDTAHGEYWRSAFKWWEELTNNDDFWDLYDDRIRQLDDPRLTPAFSRSVRRALPEAMDQINALLAMRYAEHDQAALVRTHLIYMQETNRGQDNVPQTLASIVEPLKTRISTATQQAEANYKREPANAFSIAQDLLQAVEQQTKVVRMLLHEKDPLRHDICESVGDVLYNLAERYFGQSRQTYSTILLMEAARRFASSEALTRKIDQAQRNVRQQQQHLDAT